MDRLEHDVIAETNPTGEAAEEDTSVVEPRGSDPESNFPLRFFAHHDDDARLAPYPELERLIGLYLRAAQERSAHLALVWPGELRSITLIHGLACIQRWSEGYKRGLRALFYPAKRNSFNELNHIFVSRSKLVELGNLIYEPSLGKGVTNGLIKEGLMLRDSFLFAVNSMKEELADASLRPSLNELLPHFMQPRPGADWPSYSERFYRRLKTKLALRRQGKALQESVFPDMGAPESAPDALFAFHRELTKFDLEQALKSFRKMPPPNVVLIDATHRALKAKPGTLNRIADFIGQLRDYWKDDVPGILVATDDPRQMGILQAALMRASPEHPAKVRLEQHGFVLPTSGYGLTKEGAGVKSHRPTCPVRTVVLDFEAGNLINQFHQCAKRLEALERPTDSVHRVMSFLSRTAHLPGGLRALEEELERADSGQRVRSIFDWLHHKVPLLELIRCGEAQDEASTLTKLLEKADQLIDAQRAETPMGLRIETELLEARASGKTVTIALKSPLHRRVLQTALRNRLPATDDLPETASLLVTKELAAEVAKAPSDRLVYADLSAAVLRDLTCGDFEGGEMVLILTAPMASYLKYALEPVIQMPEFAAFHERLRSIVAEIENQFSVANVDLLGDINILQGTFKLKTYDEDDPSVPDAEAVLVDLDNGLLLRRGSHSRMYVYCPEEAADGYSGFHAVQAEALQAGQQLFVLSNELRELIEAALTKAGYTNTIEAEFEKGLRHYHQSIRERVDRYFKGSFSSQVAMLQHKVSRRDCSLESELQNLKYWVDLGRSEDTPFEKLAPQAPRTLKPFQAFCKELHFSDPEIHWFWDFVIQPLRGRRRKDGRWLSDIYARILFDPDSAIAYRGFTNETIGELRRQALKNVFTVLDVILPPPQE